MKITILAFALLLCVTACSPFNRGYFRLSEAPRSGADRAEWAAIPGAVNHQLKK